jgi:hypothetical protein
MPVTRSYKLQTHAQSMGFNTDDMHRFAAEAWGSLGLAIVDQWSKFNNNYFANELKPVPLVITHAQPFGKRLAFCSYAISETSGRTITLNLPKRHTVLVADANTLLHEMIHQYLFERGEYPSHDGEPWRREIMRLNKLITGREIWAGRSKSARRKRDGKVIRINAAHSDGTKSLPQNQIARWPHDGVGIDFGHFNAHHRKKVHCT